MEIDEEEFEEFCEEMKGVDRRGLLRELCKERVTVSFYRDRINEIASMFPEASGIADDADRALKVSELVEELVAEIESLREKLAAAEEKTSALTTKLFLDQAFPGRAGAHERQN